jgi:hypothetical protein
MPKLINLFNVLLTIEHHSLLTFGSFPMILSKNDLSELKELTFSVASKVVVPILNLTTVSFEVGDQRNKEHNHSL